MEALSAVSLRQVIKGKSLMTGPLNKFKEEYTNGASSVAASSDGSKMIVGGSQSNIFTANFGGSWKSTKQPPPSVGFRSVGISSNGNTAVAIGAYNEIHVSNDGGESWSERSEIASNELLSDISISAGGMHAVVVGDNGTILISHDAGVSWRRASISIVGDELEGISVSPDGLHALAIFSGGRILKSSDGGKTWALTAIYPNFFSAPNLVMGSRSIDVKISNGGSALAVTNSSGEVYVSGDGGKAWRRMAAKEQPDSFGITRYDSAVSLTGERVIAVGQNGHIYAKETADGEWKESAVAEDLMIPSVSTSDSGLYALALSATGELFTSRDGGNTWKMHGPFQGGSTNSSREKMLEDINSLLTNRFSLGDVSSSGKYFITISNEGGVLASKDQGENWVSSRSVELAGLNDIVVSDNQGSAIAVGDNGKIVARRSENLEWRRKRSGVTEDLSKVVASENGRHAVAGSARGTLLSSSDSGETWVRASIEKNYARYPAPWYYIAFALCGLLILRGLSGRPGDAPHGAAAIAATDAPAGSLDQDRLDFAHLARGISRFLRNTETRPPLTLAITGEWGSGKSSLMGQVCDDLKANGWRPVWFNAWHHQNEEQLLAALLTAVRDAGVPSWYSPSGFGFRLNLLLIRARRHMMAALLVITLAALVVALLAQHPNVSEWQGLLSLFNTIKGKGSTSEVDALQSLLPLLGAIGVLVAIGHTMRAFGVDPAVLLSSTLSRFKLKDASAQTSFRMRFAEQFGDVTEALGPRHRIVIVVDDLDRCEPDTVRKVMEAVNFLTASGKCFVMFGMATSRVLAALALSFKDIANELVQFDEAGGDERARRQEYARDYLDKLVNIEILVPKRTDLPPTRLLEQEEVSTLAPLAAIAVEIKRWWLLLPVTAAVALGWSLASLMSLPEAPEAITPPAVEEQRPSAEAERERTAPSQGKAAPEASPQPAEKKSAPKAELLPALVPGVERGISPFWFLAALGLLALIGGILFLRWLRQHALLVEDTEAFKKAVEIWTPIATFNRNSPRSIKRFGNRIRYLAMLQQGHELDEQPAWIRAIRPLRSRLDSIAEKVGLPRPSDLSNTPLAKMSDTDAALPEHLVVALAGC
jgi:photosystem II stability/assembly factor-like uncharacterized protein